MAGLQSSAHTLLPYRPASPASPVEIRKVVGHAASIGTRVLINHVLYFPRCDEAFVHEMAAAGAYIEVCAAVAFPHWGYTPYDQLARMLGELDPRQCVIASDWGGIHTPWPHKGAVDLRRRARRSRPAPRTTTDHDA